MKVNLERIKTRAGRTWARPRYDRLVRIISEGWYWNPNRAGYTDIKSKAGVYTLRDAMNASGHCGEEKGIIYEFLADNEGGATQEPKGAAKLMLRAL